MQGPGEAGFPVNLTLDDRTVEPKKILRGCYPIASNILHPGLLAINLDEERRAAKWL
jgi:hypothetical protein